MRCTSAHTMGCVCVSVCVHARFSACMYAHSDLSTPHHHTHSSLAEVIVTGRSMTSSHLFAEPQYRPSQQVFTLYLAVWNSVAKALALLPAYHRVTPVFGLQAEAQATFAATSGLCQEVCNKLGRGWKITGQLGVISS